MALNYSSTKEIPVSESTVGQVIGQEEAVAVIKKAAGQRRHVLLIGDPGTGKCVSEDTTIVTHRGPILAKDLFELHAGDFQIKEDGVYALPRGPMHLASIDPSGKVTWKPISCMYKGRKKILHRLTLRSGIQLEISGDHPLLTLQGGKPVFSPSHDMCLGMPVGVSRQIPWERSNAVCPELRGFIRIGDTFSIKRGNGVISTPITIPQIISSGLAYFLGLYIAEGRWQGNMVISNQNVTIQDKIKKIIVKEFSYPEHLIKKTKDGVVVKKSTALIEFLHQTFQIPIETTQQSSLKTVPNLLYTATPEVIGSFFSGYIDGDGYVTRKYGIQCVSKSQKLIKGLSLLLLGLGIRTFVKTIWKRATNSNQPLTPYYSILISDSTMGRKISTYLNLEIDYKKESLLAFASKRPNTNVDVIPNVQDKIYLEKLQSFSPHQESLTESSLQMLIHGDLFWDRLDKIEILEKQVYDFQVEGTHNFIIEQGAVVHNSMLGLALSELLPKEKLVDILAFPNINDENQPMIRTIPAGQGRDIISRASIQSMGMLKNQNLIMFVLIILAMFAPWWARSYYHSDIMFAAFFLGGMLFVATFVMFLSLGKRAGLIKLQVPKVIVDNFKKKTAPFFDATGAHAGALLGDVLHDPFQSGGLGTPAHERVVAGMIHKAHLGVLFIDEIATLAPWTQQELLTALQEGKFSITGQSERSAGAMVRTEPVPCNFVLVAAGNLETLKNLHPALRSRIRGYGIEVYMKETMLDTPENRDKIARLVAQEVVKDKKIPHFDKQAVGEIIEEARRMANRKDHLTLRLRELGGLVRAAGDLAVGEGVDVVKKKHVIDAKKIARTLEQQLADRYIERKKEYEIIITTGKRVGRVNGLAVIGGGPTYSGIILPIESEVTVGGKEREIIATGKLGDIAKEAVKNVSAIIKKYFGEDIKEKYDLYVQFLQTYEGVEGDSASIAVATSIISALKKVPVKQDYAMTGSLSVRGEVLPIGGVSAKVEACIDAGIKNVIVPKSNVDDIVVDPDRLTLIKIIPVETIEQVLIEVLDWKGKGRELKKIQKNA